MIELVDTHCHVHFSDYSLDADEVIAAAIGAGVTRMICVGCTLGDSKLGVKMTARHKSIWASVGVHPHEAKFYVKNDKALQQLRDLASTPRVVAVGEIGLDYYYNHSPKQDQQALLRYQLEIAQEYKLPAIFHVRESFDDFFANEPFLTAKDVFHSSEELRFYALGQTKTNRKLFVAFTIRDRKIRVISIRDMKKKERFVYERLEKDS